MEIWKEIPGYEGFYEVSTLGRVRHMKFNRYLKPFKSRGYLRFELSKDHKKHHFSAHRLVAEAFLPNPNNLPQINHKDENKFNNVISNLEWCTAEYNSNYGTRIERISNKKSIAIEMLDSESGECLALFKSATAASKLTGISQPHINSVCRGTRNKAGGYKWRYADV